MSAGILDLSAMLSFPIDFEAKKIKVFLNRLPLSLGHNDIWKVVPFCCPQTKD